MAVLARWLQGIMGWTGVAYFLVIHGAFLDLEQTWDLQSLVLLSFQCCPLLLQLQEESVLASGSGRAGRNLWGGSSVGFMSVTDAAVRHVCAAGFPEKLWSVLL